MGLDGCEIGNLLLYVRFRITFYRAIALFNDVNPRLCFHRLQISRLPVLYNALLLGVRNVSVFIL